MIATRLTLGPLDTNCWIAQDDSGGPLVVIDPAGDAPQLFEAIAGRPVSAVVLTHGHWDHLGAVAELVEKTGAPLLVHTADGSRITTPDGTGGTLFGFDHVAPSADRLLVDDDLVEAGRLELRVLHTPGHTKGSICLWDEAGGELFSGDTLFAGSVGRTDFEGGDPRELRESIARLAALPEETRVHPGHGPDTTIERERRINPFWPRA